MKHLTSITCRLLLLSLLAVSASVSASAQRTQAAGFDDDWVFWGYPAVYLNYQAKMAYPLIDKMLQAYPPAVETDKHRQLALVTLDQFLHDADYYRRDAFYPFVNVRMARMLDAMDETVLSGVRVYKLYNSGFILKTLKTTVAIDIVPGGENYKALLTDSVIGEIADRCDMLLVTNSDSKHANRKVANAFVEAGKKVIVPKGLWSNLGETVVATGEEDDDEGIDLGAVTLHILPGHNGNVRNNVYIMDFKGRGIVAHTGAQDNNSDWEWIDRIHDQYNIDILLTKSQNIYLDAMLKGFQPRLVITSHENEMESTVDRRESYWTTQKRMKSLAELGIPNVVMTWGEAFDYADSESKNISSSANKVLIDGHIYIERKGSIYTPSGIKVK